jgi:hypothetical protein
MTLPVPWAAAPRAILACPVCFGQSDSPLASGINSGIFVMLGLIGVLWVAFACFFIHLKRSAAAAAKEESGRRSAVKAEGTV